jgi:hypothetical protein
MTIIRWREIGELLQADRLVSVVRAWWRAASSPRASPAMVSRIGREGRKERHGQPPPNSRLISRTGSLRTQRELQPLVVASA